MGKIKTLNDKLILPQAEIGSDIYLPHLIDVNVFGSSSFHSGWNKVINTAFLLNSQLQSNGQTSDYFICDVVLTKGVWDIEILHSKAQGQGIITVYIDNVPVGTIDCYIYGSADNNIRTTLNGVIVSSTGKKTLKLGTPTKNASSSGYYVGVQHIQLRRMPDRERTGTVSTSTNSAATAYPNQRKEDRFSNGTLFGLYYDGSSLLCRYLSNWNATWAAPTTGATVIGGAEGSCFIDEDNYIHVSASSLGGTLHYVRGTPTFDASKNMTSVAWSAPLVVAGTGYDKYSGIVAHREDTGWKAHVVWSSNQGGALVKYQRIAITASNVISLDGITTTVSATGGSYHTFPSIAVDNAKLLQVVWTKATIGTGAGIRFRQAPYSSGSWTWGSEEAVTESYYAEIGQMGPITIDGNASSWVVFGDANTRLRVFRRASAGGWTNLTPSPDVMAHHMTAMVDDSALHVFYNYFSNGLRYRKHDGSAWGAEVIIDSDQNIRWITGRRNTFDNIVDVIYTTGSSSPYTVKSYRLDLSYTENSTTPVALDKLPWLIDINPFMTPISHVNWPTSGIAVNTSYIYNGRSASSAVQNAEISFDVVLAMGTWTIELMGGKNSGYGIMSVQIDGVEVGVIDQYSSSLSYNDRFGIVGIQVTKTGKRRLTFKMTTKNASSSGYTGIISHIQLRRTA